MTMTMVVTNDMPSRTRGFLASVLLEVAPGVYAGPHVSASVRERIWAVITAWHDDDPRGSAILVWPDKKAVGRMALSMIGTPQRDLVLLDGVALSRRDIRPSKADKNAP